VNAEAILEAVFILNPRTGERARRLACAVQLLRANASKLEAARQIRLRFEVSQPVAWHVVNMAADMVLIEKDKKP
jgi:hypothetical protein